MSKIKVTAPDYYPKFKCKCGDCRNTCCSGWGICFSMPEYFKLLGIDVSEDLRHKLDCALSVLPDASPERYAKMNPNWMGFCPMQGEDGFCMLQLEKGEKALPLVCQTYPRGLRTAFDPEYSCSNSCEAVTEKFLHRKDKLYFIQTEAEELNSVVTAKETPENAEKMKEIRDFAIQMLQDRDYSMSERLWRLGFVFDKAISDEELDMEEFLKDKNSMDNEAGFKNFKYIEKEEHVSESEKLAIKVQLNMAEKLAADSKCLGEDTRIIDEFLLEKSEELTDEVLEKAVKQYRKAKSLFEKHFPDWENFFEHLLVNHVFFDGFPYSGRHECIWDEYLALTGVFAMARLMLVCLTRDDFSDVHLIDVCSQTFRFIEHTGFTWNVPIVMREEMADAFEKLVFLIFL